MKPSTTSVQYAIVDIETTGGYASGSGITEIAILIHDGHRVVDRYETLINPHRPIPLAIQALTGITDALVADSPAFHEVAPRIYALLADHIFVAHNVNFDYSFVKHHLAAAGYHLDVRKLCTVRMSRKLRPGLPSYSLGKLCDALGISINNRHRAMGDAEATAILFGQLMEGDTQGVIVDMLKKTSKHQQLPPNLPKEQFDALPNGIGVYYFRDKGGKTIYVGKARDIRKRIAQHFTGHTPQLQRQHFLRHIHSVTYERCGTELMALLLEAAEIQRLWPAYNRALKRFEPKFALYAYEDCGDYLRLAIGKHGKHHNPVHVFHRHLDAYNLLHRLIREFDLHPGLCGIGKPIAPPPPSTHNPRIQQAIYHLGHHLPTFAIIDQGRSGDEKSCIWVEQGKLYGMGYISQHADLATPGAVKEALTPYPSNHYMMQLIYSYAEKHPAVVWRPDLHSQQV
ncbi:exonuclease domain-containing protein [Parapedobacter sp. 10938]|uniref:exonuclease domain-containing protein n=1 Tax=Parapedobacter flavus TaxID=3110225 RepID=UPI002DC05389|nr:exonuclease domain-containing protein [Parapedobacter sp. 10938]MEC3879689.1 exonuclease domain-containing protein [Parapedobacter sp. 10938]